ncbi:Peptidoglycan O-acetyltransferase [Rosistilla ulvae]|uniref:Peptidoglycan O-acetyltransferase n=1 Tax=Rosistilla ulvae TaxID=1930277 RepID=A0A517M1Y5_9BACT|nr:MBOAT family O-acyltransferase [Rosistilla ulvae]QDS88891.1 Peptidoglycan O-acetyltransferase [Rosistilla ulvae]
MLFHSPEFFAFFPIVFALYWATQRWLWGQNLLVLVASYVFYGWWDWRFLGLIFASSCFDFVAGRAIDVSKSNARRRWLVISSLVFNLGLLGCFKYFNFFAAELAAGFESIGITLDAATLNIVLPVGISFYTFQTLSYTLDIHAGRMKSTRDPLAFFAFVAFFPQLVAGPIERASHLLPQFFVRRRFQYATAVAGSRLILWGFFKKVLVADSCAVLVNDIFADYPSQSGWTLLMGAFFFAFQIYGDFSGYSDIARGLGRLLGFDLMQNFAFPYFSRNVAEFWRRWHISLSTWFRDYLFIPLGGSRGSKAMVARNLLIVFVVSGLWHGANWTFIAWGAVNALMIMPILFIPMGGRGTESVADGRLLPSLRETLQMVITFAAICVTWIIFRSETLPDAYAYLCRMVDQCIAYPGGVLVAFRRYRYEPAMILVVSLVASEWISRWKQFSFDRLPLGVRWTLYQLVFSVVVWIAMYRDTSEFIYFQF